MPLPYKRVDLQFSNQSSEDWFVHDFPLQQAWLRFGATSTIHYRTQLLFSLWLSTLIIIRQKNENVMK